MAERDNELTVEKRLTGLEHDLQAHIAVCEKDGREVKYWSRFIGGAIVLYIIKEVLPLVFHAPLG